MDLAFQDIPSLVEEVLEDEADEEDDPCIGKKCTANEHCCDGDVCVDTEENSNSGSKYKTSNGNFGFPSVKSHGKFTIAQFYS